MERELLKAATVGTEGGRSPTGVPTVAGAGSVGIPLAASGEGPAAGPPPAAPELPAVEAEAPAGPAVKESPGQPESAVPAGFLRGPRLLGRKRGASALRKEAAAPVSRGFNPEERLLILDTWQRSALPAEDFAHLVGLSTYTLYTWKRRFEELGPGGLMDQPRGAKAGSKLPELTKRTILMLKEANPEWGCQRISDLLVRGPALPASPAAVARLLHEAGYELVEEPTAAHPPVAHRFERAAPNELWQTDLFTFILKRQNRRVYLVVFMDDHSRFITGYGLHGTQSAAMVIEVLRAALASYPPPAELLSDNGTQYVTWRGKSAFARELERRGIRHLVAAPRHPQTLGKVERFWGSLWRECLENALFLDLADAQRRIGHYIDHHNFQRPHQGIEGACPADRYFAVGSEVLKVLKERVAANALELARHGVPKKPFYLTGQVGGKSFSVHAEGERVILRRGEGEREEVELVAPEPPATAQPPEPPALPEPVCPSVNLEGGESAAEPPLPPGASPLDAGLERLKEAFGEGGEP